MIEVVVSGGSGRLGGRIVAAIEAADGLSLVANLGRNDAADEIIVSGRVLVETAPHTAATAHVERAAAVGVPVVVATTGFNAEERRRLHGAADKIPTVIAPNLSPGVTVLLDLVEKASRALADYDVEIVEMHHNQKKDAPSGTAWALAQAAATARGRDADKDAILARAGETGARGVHEIGIQTLRGGDVYGEHTVMLVGATERVELIHRAATRDVFASGAVQAVRFIADQAPGLYSMRDVLGLT